MKIALLLGINQYSQPFPNLPACLTDIQLMKRLIEVTGQYQDMLCIFEDTTGAKVKAEISTWIEKSQGQTIEEIFFYYTGHGEFYNGEFYFPMTDFDKTARKQTSLTNSEIDSWLRSLNPKLTVKVVDACHAGVAYIKDDGAILEKYLDMSGKEFKKCYFMFSSTLEQSSYQDKNLSFFTRSFLKAVQTHQADKIRYRDIIDFVSDDFSNNSYQNPFFVTQAHNTEVFCAITNDVKKGVIEGEIDSTAITIALDEPESSPELLSLKQLVQKDAENYRDEQDAISLLQEVEKYAQEHQYSADLSSLYEIVVSVESSHATLLQKGAIGKWLEQNEHKYFAKATYKTEEYKTEARSTTFSEMLGGPYTTVTKKRQVLDGFRTTVELPFAVIQIHAQPKFPNLFWRTCVITYLVSKTHIRFFYYFADYLEKNWRDREVISKNINWQSKESKLNENENVRQIIQELLEQFDLEIVIKVREKFASPR